MTYSRGCGVSCVDCAAASCRCVSVDVDAEIGPESGVQRSDAELLAEQYADLLAEHTRDNPVQTAHNQSREGA